jgi:hypothetical protein
MAAGEQDLDRVIVLQRIFTDVVVAVNGRQGLIDGVNDRRQQPIRVVLRQLKQIPQQERLQSVLTGVCQTPAELPQCDLGIIIATKPGNPGFQVRVTDEHQTLERRAVWRLRHRVAPFPA